MRLILLFSIAVTASANEGTSSFLVQLATKHLTTRSVVFFTDGSNQDLNVIVDFGRQKPDTTLVSLNYLELPRDFVQLNYDRKRTDFVFISKKDRHSQTVSFFDNLKLLEVMQGNRLVVVADKNQPLEELATSRVLRQLENVLFAVASTTHSGENCFLMSTHVIQNTFSVKLLGKWSRSRGFWNPEFDLFPKKLANLQGYRVKIGTFDYPPAVILQRDEDSVRFAGIETEIFKTFAQHKNLSWELKEISYQEQWGGYIPENDSFTGLTGYISRGEVDFGFCDMWIHPQRINYMDFTAPYTTSHDCFVTAKPRLLPHWVALYLPLTGATWAATLTTVGAAILVLYSIVRFMAKLTKRDLFLHKTSNIVLYLTGNILQVQQPSDPVDFRTRSFFIWWFFFVTIIPTAYRSALTSYLTIPIYSDPINTLQRLVESPLQKLIYSNTLKGILQNSTDPVIQQLGNELIVQLNWTAAMKEVLEGKSATSAAFNTLQYVIQKNFTDSNGQSQLHIINECLLPSPVAFALPKNSLFTEVFSNDINRLAEAGFVRYYQDHVFNTGYGKSTLATESEKAAAANVVYSLEHLQGAFLLYGLGVACSILVYFIELVWHYKCK